MADPFFVVLVLAFGPPLVYLAGLATRHARVAERGHAGSAVLGFAYGATLSLLVLALVYVLLGLVVADPVQALQAIFPERSIAPGARRDFTLIVLLAPIAEEAAKGLGVLLLGSRLTTGRDGVFLGAAVGLGFAGTETLFYLVSALPEDHGLTVASLGIPLGIVLLALTRAFTTALLHPAATALTGRGIGRSRARGIPVLLGVLPWFALAVTLHAVYNFLAAFAPIQVGGVLQEQLNVLVAFILASIAWGSVKRGVAARA